MTEPRNGYEFLKRLAEEKNKERHSFNDLFEYLNIKARKQGVPLIGQFELTPLCNFNCKMCYVHLTKEQMHDQPLLTVDQWKEIIRQACEAGMIRATISGGECLTYPGFKEIYLYLQELGCEIEVLTNGALIDEEWVHFFQEHMPIQMQITLYGGDEEAYERVTGQRKYKTVVENIRLLNEAHIPVKLTVTPNKYLGEGVFETIRIGKSINKACLINAALFSPREETGRSDHEDDLDIDTYIRIYNYRDELDGREYHEVPEEKLPPIGGNSHECKECGLKCGGGRSSFDIDWKGVMTPCTQLPMIKSYPLKDGFKEAWKSINQVAESWPRVPECDGCAYESVCFNCAAQMLRVTKPGKQPIALCERTKYLVQHGAWQISGCE